MAIRAAAIRHATLTMPPRPTCPIPLDRRHEFLSTTLPYDDPIVRTWIEHFNRTGVPFERIDRNGRTQLYLHRVRFRYNQAHAESWCCSTKQ